MKYIFIFFALCILFSDVALGQTTSSTNRAHNIYLEAAGPGGIYSLNYDVRFQNSSEGLGVRVGASYFAIDGESLFTAPFILNYLIGKKGNYLELGLGATVAYHHEKMDYYCSCIDTNEVAKLFEDEGFQIIGTIVIGYRRQPVDGGLMFRVGFSPLFNKETIAPYPYLSLGYSF